MWVAAHNAVPGLVHTLMNPFRVDVEVSSHASIPPCVNDASVIERARAAAALDVVGPAGVVGTEQSLGGEDFGWIADQVPSALLRLGVRGPGVADAGDLHQGGFDLDESAMSIGVRVFSRLAAGDSDG